MKLQYGDLINVRKAWHDAFDPNVQSIDMRDVLNEFGVQYTAKGADNRIIDHAEKGIIQHAGTLREVKALGLVRVGYETFAREDVTGIGVRRKPADLARAATMDKEQYLDERWGYFFHFGKSVASRLPERALPPVGSVIWDYIDANIDSLNLRLKRVG
jgi:hypothetical protein